MSGSWAERLVVLILCVTFVATLVPPAQAGIIGTGDFLELQTRRGRIENIHAGLARADVRERLVAMGVEPAAAQNRVAQLTDRELQLLEQHIARLPAGGEPGFAVGVLVLLVILAILVLPLILVLTVL